jgi:hypothetical protein
MRRAAPFACAILLASAAPAFAHSAARGFVLLLPVGYVIAGGALAVLLSFSVLSALPERASRSAGSRPPKEGARPRIYSALSPVSALILLLLPYAGIAGPRDPAENLPRGIEVRGSARPADGRLYRLRPVAPRHADGWLTLKAATRSAASQ